MRKLREETEKKKTDSRKRRQRGILAKKRKILGWGCSSVVVEHLSGRPGIPKQNEQPSPGPEDMKFRNDLCHSSTWEVETEGSHVQG